jgi:hypothetical protein
MISQCSNSDCSRPLIYLENGRVIRTIRETSNFPEIQHYWLCGECYVLYDFSISKAGDVSYLRREKPLIMHREYYSGPRFAP